MVSSHQAEEAEASSEAQKQEETLPGGPAVWRPWVQGRAGERGRGVFATMAIEGTPDNWFAGLSKPSVGGEPAEQSCGKMSFSSNAAIPMQVRVASCPCENRHPNSPGPLGWEKRPVPGKKLCL